MAVQKKTSPAAKTAAKPAAAPKLIPRTAPKVAVKPPAAPVAPAEPVVEPVVEPKAAPAAAAKAVTPATAAATAKARPPRKPSRVDETVAKHQAALADALVKAQAIRYDQPKVMKQEASKPKKADKVTKVKKTKLVRDSYAMPEAEYAKIGELKKRLAALGAETKKSELLRGGIAMLASLNDAELKAVMGRVERIKTGRPNKDARK
ncbi:MAG TPA: hypothetical protein VN639_22210 [Azonexus sp.]|nr:hypothetical protein [Azonexus sp.]